jgi:hypothetical protein
MISPEQRQDILTKHEKEIEGFIPLTLTLPYVIATIAKSYLPNAIELMKWIAHGWLICYIGRLIVVVACHFV